MFYHIYSWLSRLRKEILTTQNIPMNIAVTNTFAKKIERQSCVWDFLFVCTYVPEFAGIHYGRYACYTWLVICILLYLILYSLLIFTEPPNKQRVYQLADVLVSEHIRARNRIQLTASHP